MNLSKLIKVIIKVSLITLVFFLIFFLIFRFTAFVLSFFDVYDDSTAVDLSILTVPVIFFVFWFVIKKLNLPIKKEVTALEEEFNKLKEEYNKIGEGLIVLVIPLIFFLLFLFAGFILSLLNVHNEQITAGLTVIIFTPTIIFFLLFLKKHMEENTK